MDGFARGAKWDKRSNVIGAVWLYVFIWWFVQDAAKVVAYRIMVAYNWFGYNDTGKMEFGESTLKWREEHMNDDGAASAH